MNYLNHKIFHIKLLAGLIVILSFVLGCSQNIFDEIADKDTDEAKYFQARREINARNYTTAISLLESLSPSFIAARARVPVYSSAYAGRCGLEFLTLLENIQNSASGTLLTTLMAAFPGATVSGISDCIQAETIMESIGDESARNGDENLFMAFVSLAKIGTILSFHADTDDDATPDGTFDECVEVADSPDPADDAAGRLSDNDVREFGASLAVAISSLQAVGGNYIDTAEFDGICNETGPPVDLSILCDKTDPADFVDDEVRALRWIIGSTDIGIGSCGADFTTCATVTKPGCDP